MKKCSVVTVFPGDVLFVPNGYLVNPLYHGSEKWAHVWSLTLFEPGWCTHISSDTLSALLDMNNEVFDAMDGPVWTERKEILTKFFEDVKAKKVTLQAAAAASKKAA